MAIYRQVQTSDTSISVSISIRKSDRIGFPTKTHFFGIIFAAPEILIKTDVEFLSSYDFENTRNSVLETIKYLNKDRNKENVFTLFANEDFLKN